MLSYIKNRAAKVIEDAKAMDLSAVGDAVTGAVERVQSNIGSIMEDDERIGRGSIALARYETADDMNAAVKALNALLPGCAVIVPDFKNTIVFCLSTLPTLAVAKSFRPTVFLV